MKSDWAVCICVIYGTDHSVCVTIIDTGKGFDIWEKAQRLDFQCPPTPTAIAEIPTHAPAPRDELLTPLQNQNQA